MKLMYAFFAEAITAEKSGVFSGLRCGLEYLTAPQFPTTVWGLSLLAKIQFDASDCGTPHDFVVKVFDPHENQMAPDLAIVANPETNTRDASGPVGFTLHFKYYGFPAATPGRHLFRIFTGDNWIGETAIDFFVRDT